MAAAISCLAEDGLHKISFQSIARRAGLDQPLVVYHLKTKAKIFPAVWNYLYEKALARTEAALGGSGTCMERLLEYAQVSIDIFAENREITMVYFQLHLLAAFDVQMREVNTLVKRKAIQRIANIIIQGQKESEFVKDLDPYLTAKTIHSSLVGILINSVTETEDFQLNTILQSFKTLLSEALSLK